MLQTKVRVPKPDELPFGPACEQSLAPKVTRIGLATVPEIMASGRKKTTKRRLKNNSADQFLHRGHCRLVRNCSDCFSLMSPALNKFMFAAFGSWANCWNLVGDFFKYVTARGLQKQEGILFRHVLRFIMLCDEFASIRRLEVNPSNGNVCSMI